MQPAAPLPSSGPAQHFCCTIQHSPGFPLCRAEQRDLAAKLSQATDAEVQLHG